MQKGFKIIQANYTVSEDLTVEINKVKLENNSFLTRQQLIIAMELYKIKFYVNYQNNLSEIKIVTFGFSKLIQIQNSNKYCDDLGDIGPIK